MVMMMTRRRLWNLKTRSIQLSQMSLHSNRKSNIEADYSLRCVCEENVRAMDFVSVGGVMQPTWGNHTSEDVDSRTLIIIITIHIFFVPSDNDVSWCAIWYQPMWDEVSLQNSTWNLNGGGEGRMMHIWLKGQNCCHIFSFIHKKVFWPSEDFGFDTSLKQIQCYFIIGL